MTGWFRKTRIAWCGLIALMSLLAGCQNSPRGYWYLADDPKTTVQPLQVEEVGPDGTRLIAKVVLDNQKNDAELRLRETQYTVTVDGIGRFRFTQTPDSHLPARGMAVLELPVAFDASPEQLRGRKYHVSGKVQYNHDGDYRHLLNETEYPYPAVGFKGSGTLE